MISALELESCSIFACLNEADRQRFAERAADVRLADGEWLIREGELPYFCLLLEGHLKLLKDVLGRQQLLHEYKPGEWFGEVPILLRSPALVSIQASSASVRVARFDAQQLLEMVQSSEAFSAQIMKVMSERLHSVQKFASEAPISRVLLVGTQYEKECRDIRAFLSANRIPYEWIDGEREPGRLPECMAGQYDGPTVIIDQQYCVETPTVRSVAQALGIRTAPRFADYDVVIAGAGPAGLAAGVYGASEGLKVLMIERSAAGGQAGTSSRIENYLGFPNGISGDELSERALKQSDRFGAEIAMTRWVERLEVLEDGRFCVQMDGGDRVSACTVLLATGVEWRMLEAEGVDRLQGRGVLYGASRNEASNVVGKKVFLVGGGNSAGQAAVFFANYAAEVNVLVRSKGLELTMSTYLIDQLAAKRNVRIEPFTEVMKAEGDDHLERIVTRTRVPGTEECLQTRDADALFVMIGADASTAWLPDSVARDAKGYIYTGRDVTSWPLEREPLPLETSLPGVFCAGDVRHDSIKRVSSGVGEGSMAVAFIHQFLALRNF